MKVRIHYTGPDGRPVSCTGDYFAGNTFLEVVEGMMIHPFTLETEPVAYMRRILASIGEMQELPDEPDEAAEAFLSQLVAAGYAAFEPEGNGEKTEKAAAEMGRKGGKARTPAKSAAAKKRANPGLAEGRKKLASLTPEQRRENAIKAAKARWEK